MSRMLVEHGIRQSKVMSVGNTCFTPQGAGSAIDYGIMDRRLSPWFWNGCTLDTTLATHKPVHWCMKWQREEKIDVIQSQGKVPLARIP